MAEAKREGGLYYVNGKAVDANGEEVKDAPKQPKDTPPGEVTREALNKDPVQRLADTLDRTFGGAAHSAAIAAQATPRSVEAEESEEKDAKSSAKKK